MTRADNRPRDSRFLDTGLARFDDERRARHQRGAAATDVLDNRAG